MAEQQPTVGPPQQKKHHGPIGKVVLALDAFYHRVKWLKRLVMSLPHFPMMLILIIIWACIRPMNSDFMHTYVFAIVVAGFMVGALAIECGQALYASFTLRRYVGDLGFSGMSIFLMGGTFFRLFGNGHWPSLGDGFIFVLCWFDFFAGPMIYLKARSYLGTGIGGHGDEQTVSVDVDGVHPG